MEIPKYTIPEVKTKNLVCTLRLTVIVNNS